MTRMFPCSFVSRTSVKNNATSRCKTQIEARIVVESMLWKFPEFIQWLDTFSIDAIIMRSNSRTSISLDEGHVLDRLL
jgi:hypothetical protein